MSEYVEYSDVETIESFLVGKKIVSFGKVSTSEVAGYGHGSNAYAYTLDDGSRLLVADAHGGCACANGCFYVTPSETFPEAVITGVRLTETVSWFDYKTGQDVDEEIKPGSLFDGSATIRLFVYSAGAESELFSSEGGDNGYYGWGHHIAIERVEVAK